MNQSIETLDSPEFINLKPMDINPLMSECTIKVMYIGQNRNGSFINKETATKMAETLRGAPIVGYYKAEKEDFADHGQRVTIDGGEIKFDCMTVPYGFVAPNSDVWFQKFDDIDEFGNSVEHEYLMTTGYLWTGQYEEAKLALEGRPQSMELDEETLDGKWSYDTKTQMDFFIINDATFSKLCILGEDVEPCFEGAAVNHFSLDEKFKNNLYSMMQDLKKALQGGQDVNSENKEVQQYEILEQEQEEKEVVEVEQPVENEIETPAEDVEFAKKEECDPEDKKEEDSKEEAKDDKEDKEEEDKKFSKEEEKEDKAEDKKDDKEEDSEDYACGGGDGKKKKYELLEEEHEELKAKFAALEAECAELREFKNSIERKDKEALIEKFTALSEEDKKEVVNNIDNYSLAEIKKELASICFDKGVNFTKAETVDVEEHQEQNITYSLSGSDNAGMDDVPDEILALRRARQELKNK